MTVAPDPETPQRALRMQVVKGLGLAAVLIVLMAWLAGTFKPKVQPGEIVVPPPTARPATVRVEKKTFPLLIDQVGTVRAHTEAQVSARIMAQVKEIRVREGESVCGAGSKDCVASVLAVLDDRDIQAKMRQAEAQATTLEKAGAAAKSKLQAAQAQVSASRANLKQAVSDHARYEDLERHRAATGQQLEHARAQRDIAQAQAAAAAQEAQAAQDEIERLKAQKEQAEAALAEARVTLSYTVIEAPFSGKLLKKMVSPGDMASPGQPLFFIETAAQPEVHALVSESLLPHIKTGQELDAVIDALGQTFSGRVREIVPKSDPSTRTVLVKVSLPAAPELVNGLFGRIRVRYGTYDALVVPAEAVSEAGQLFLVHVAGADGRRQRRFVTLGEVHGDLVEVLSGLREGEEVAIPWTGKEARPTTG
jgi:HlyD family secretion protein